MKKQDLIMVVIHVKNDPEHIRHNYILSPFEFAILRGLVSLHFSSEIQIADVVRAARMFNKDLDAGRAYTPLRNLLAKKLITASKKFLPTRRFSTLVSLRSFLCYSTNVDSIAVLTEEQQVI